MLNLLRNIDAKRIKEIRVSYETEEELFGKVSSVNSISPKVYGYVAEFESVPVIIEDSTEKYIKIIYK